MLISNRILLVILAMLIALPAVAEDIYVIDAKVIAISAGESPDFHVEGGASGVSLGDGTVYVLDTETLRIGDQTLLLDGEGRILWNDEPGLPEDAGIEILMSPRMKATAGQRAAVVIGTRLQYFHREGDTWTLRFTKTDEAPGLEFGCTVEPDGGELLHVDYDLKLTVMKAREKIEGVHLDVGRPIVRTQKTASRVKVRPGRWTVISARMVKEANREEGDLLLVLLKVEPS